MSYFTSNFNSNGVPFMDNATKGDLKTLCGLPLHITDHGYINGKRGKYAVLQLAEKPNMFFFANKFVTEMLEKVDADNMASELANQTIIFEMKQSRETGNEYMAFNFVDDTADIPF